MVCFLVAALIKPEVNQKQNPRSKMLSTYIQCEWLQDQNKLAKSVTKKLAGSEQQAAANS